MTFKTLCSLCVLFLLPSACAPSKPKHVFAAPQSAEEKKYQEAVRLLDNDLNQEAHTAFSDLKNAYPYSNYAILADLGIADSFFARKKYVEALDAYSNFIKYHPNHDEVPYAMLHTGHTHFEQIPSDFWFLPPAAEKDQIHTQQAHQAYLQLLQTFPKHPLAEEAQKRVFVCENKLAAHEHYAARFYWKRRAYAGTAQRAENLLRTYPNSSYTAEALWLAGASRGHLKQYEQARKHLTQLQESFPKTTYAQKASSLLKTFPVSVIQTLQQP